MLELVLELEVVQPLLDDYVAGAGSFRVLAGPSDLETRVFDPDLDDTPAGGDEAFALIHGLYWLTINVSGSRPLLLVVDDLQWADNASLRWLGYLTRRIEGHPIGVLAAARPSADEDPLLSELLTDRATTVVRPNTLSTTAVATLARSVVGEHAEEAFSLA